MSWELEVPADAVKSPKNDTEESEDEHAGPTVTRRGWSIEGRDERSTRRTVDVVTIPNTTVNINEMRRKSVKNRTRRTTNRDRDRKGNGRRMNQPK